MTILYRPVKITSAEQAEALPIGTSSVHHDDAGLADQACIRVRGGWWCTEELDEFGVVWLVPHDRMIGDTALVPIRAIDQRGWDIIDPAVEGAPSPTAHRYVTPWEEA